MAAFLNIFVLLLRGSTHRRVIMVALNTEPLDSCHLHIGELQMFSLGVGAGVPSAPLWTYTFHPVPLAEGRFFNQCIQKKGTEEKSS